MIETSLSLNSGDEIVDHQARVIEIKSWAVYIDEFKNSKTVVRDCAMPGATIPYQSIVKNLKYDDFHLSCDVYYKDRGTKFKKFAYLIENEKWR